MYIYQSCDGYWQVAQLTNSRFKIAAIVRNRKALGIMDGYYHCKADAEVALQEFYETMA